MSQWATGLFDCFLDPMQTLDTCLCPCCSVSRQLNALEAKPDTFDPQMCIFPGLCASCASAYIRVKVVEKYAIPHQMPMEGILGCCCAACSMCQTHRELTTRNAWPGGMFLHKTATTAYGAMK
jgi:Cys-rich protein (TIGR01571 family)